MFSSAKTSIMKRTVGIIFIAIVCLNVFGAFMRTLNGEPIGSPAYIIILVMMFFGGVQMTRKGSRNKLPTKPEDENQGLLSNTGSRPFCFTGRDQKGLSSLPQQTPP